MFAALHKDLLAHLDGHTLAHPLLEWPYAYPAFYARLNRWYEHKRAVMAGTHTANEWDMFHPNLDLDERLDKYIYDTFTDDMDYETLLSASRLCFFGQCWTAPEMIAQTSSFFELFTGHNGAQDITSVMTTSEKEQWHALPATIDVYRGHKAGLLDGCCWYPDRDIAAAWASIPYNGRLSSGRIAKQHVRAVFNRRGEVEFIVRHQHVNDVTTVQYETVAS